MKQSPLSRLAKGYQTVAILFLNTLLLLAGIELLSRPIIHALNARDDRRFVTRMSQHSYYARQSWAETYWREHNQLTRRYQPYTIWRQQPFAGETITITEDGYRLTPNTECDSEATKIFVFGGSTIWGQGAPDWGTIPAYLQQQLAASSNTPVCVRNLGETAYVSTQEVIELMWQLQNGHIPDVVVFYDGMNDVAASYVNGRAGTHFAEADVASRMTARPTLTAWLRETGTFQMLTRLAQKAGLLVTSVPPPPPDGDLLTQEILQTYFTNYRIVVALADNYGFRAHFFLQPLAISGQQVLTAEEERLVMPQSDYAVFNRQVYEQLAEQVENYPCLTDLGHLFDDHSESIWVDLVHITPEGNEKVAEAIAQVLRQDSPPVCEGRDQFNIAP